MAQSLRVKYYSENLITVCDMADLQLIIKISVYEYIGR